MSDYGQRHRPPSSGGHKGPEAEDPKYVGGGVAADRAWAQQRIRQYFAARQEANFARHVPYAAVQRKAADTGDWRKRFTGGRDAEIKAKQEQGGARGAAAIPQSGGAPLPGNVRAKMEPRLGADLSSVKIHVGAESEQAAAGFGARAFTAGQDVHFGAGEYAPGTKEGDRLLAHELTHAVQAQRSGAQRKVEDASADGPAEKEGEHGDGAAEVSQPGQPAEVEADAIGDHVAEQLHGRGDQKNAESAGQAKAPEIGTKLRDGIVHAMRQDNPLRNEDLYHGPKPEYENPGHHDKTSPNFNARKSPLPPDAEQVYQRAVPSPDGLTWWGLSVSGDIYRYQSSNGKAHWNGSESTGVRVPNAIVKRLRNQGDKRKK